MRLSLWIGLLIAGVLSLPAFAADFTVPSVPTHYVTDNAGALSSATQASLDAELKTYEKSTGHQVIVWIGDTTGDVPLETWTGETAHTWRIGRRGKDDGAILFLFTSDHKVRIEVGYGLEGSLTDADASRIIRDDIVPHMKAGDTDGAVSGGVAGMLRTITPDYAGVAAPSESAGLPAFVWVIVIAVFGFFTLLTLFVVVAARRTGAPAWRKGTKGGAIWSGGAGGSSWSSSSSSSGDSSSSSSSDDFSSGGGDFGGGGASGSW